MHTEIRYTEAKNAEWAFCLPTTGRPPESGMEALVSESILDALGVPHELVCRYLGIFCTRKKISRNFLRYAGSGSRILCQAPTISICHAIT